MSEPAALPSPDREEQEKQEVEEYRMTLLEHLWELRTRLIRSMLALIVGFSVMLPFGAPLSSWLRRPAVPYLKDGSFAQLRPMEVFVTDLKVSLFAAVFLAAPVIFFQAWRFIAPGLYRSERRLVLPFVLFSTVFFVSGAAFGYYVILPFAMQFLLGFATDEVQSTISVAAYLSDVTRLLLAFGAVFEMPLAIFFLARAGIVTGDGLAAFRKYAVLIIFVVSAILTPPDPVTQVGLALPLIFLYEVGVVVARLWGRKPAAD